jgi:hypothetical protein
MKTCTSRIIYFYPAPEKDNQALLIYKKKYCFDTGAKGTHYHTVLFKDGKFERGQWCAKSTIKVAECRWSPLGPPYFVLQMEKTPAVYFQKGMGRFDGETRTVRLPYMAPLPQSCYAGDCCRWYENEYTKDYCYKKWYKDDKECFEKASDYKLLDRSKPSVYNGLRFAAEDGRLYINDVLKLDLHDAEYERLELPIDYFD